MPLPRITQDTPTIRQIMLYTDRKLQTRFEYCDRDLLPSKIKVVNKLVYKKNKEGATSTPDQRLQIISYSAPQYLPYNKHTTGRQMKYKHSYNISMSLLQDTSGEYSYDSKILWRVGSNKLWDDNPPQKKIKSVYKKTRDILKKKYTDKKTKKLDKIEYNKAIASVKKAGKYLSIGDYNSQERGINGDFYFRAMPLNKLYDCLYGPCTQKEFSDEDIDMPFFGKHEIGVILYLIKKKIIKL